MSPEACPDRFIREVERRQVTGLSRTTWWRLERQGVAPKRRQLSANSTGWLLSEITAWMQSRIEKAA
jgi:predicted DNA-binding transcriptional regulator AlpA